MILGTAGHIDHGKTTLVRALTGVDTDRLPEEKRRGITIELGFAPLSLDGVGTVGVVDVPGHEAFVRTMLAGASGIDLALLVIAADEGVMPQTREHLAILTLLGVRGGAVALTKSDLVDAEWLALVVDDVRTLLRHTPLETAAIVPCSATTGEGLDELRRELAAAARDIPARDAGDLLRLPVDRAFTVRGTGTVVTGTLWSGTITRESVVRLFPSGRVARVRSLESHGAAVDRALPGSRVAVALAGVDRHDISRSGVLVRDGDRWSPSSVLRADVALLDGAPSLGVRTRVRFHSGTADVGARVVSSSARVESGAGSAVPVRIVLDEPVVVRAGDRFVLRAATPAVTIGGGVVTDPHPPARRAKPWPTAGTSAAARLSLVVAECEGAGFSLDDLPVRVGAAPAELGALMAGTRDVTLIAGRLYSASLRAAVADRLGTMVRNWHAAHPLEPGLSLQHARAEIAASEELFTSVLNELSERGTLKVQGSVLADARWKAASSGADAERLDRLAAVLRLAGPEVQTASDFSAQFGTHAPALLRALEREGRVTALATDRYMDAPSLVSLVTKLQEGAKDGLPRTASQMKEILGLTRKHLIPFLEYCDRQHITVRSGDLRTVPPSK